MTGKYSNPLSKNLILLMRGGQSGPFRLAKALEAFIGCKVNSEPCA